MMYLSVNIHRSLALSSSVISFATKGSCDEVGAHLNNRQVQVCKRYIDVMNSVKFGASIALEECQHQFRYRRWNCTTVKFEKSPVFGNSANGGKGPVQSFYFVISNFVISNVLAKEEEKLNILQVKYHRFSLYVCFFFCRDQGSCICSFHFVSRCSICCNSLMQRGETGAKMWL